MANVALLSIMAIHFVYLYFFETKEKLIEDETSDDTPILSLGFLCREHRYLDATILASLATTAWDLPVSTIADDDELPEEEADDENGVFIIGSPPLLVVTHPQAILLIHHHDRPYFDDPAALAQEINELRSRWAIEQHQSWTAVDLVRWLDDELDEEAKNIAAYRLIARLLAELADDNVLAIIDPVDRQMYVYDPETERKLRSENPLAALRDPYYVPVIRVADDDPAMLAAVEEARKRWPEFVEAFENRSPDENAPFMVKAPIGPSRLEEYMWINVTGIEADVIYGTLANQPARIPDLNMGDRVRVGLDKLNDWVCLIDGQPAGGFTLEVVADHARRTNNEDKGPH